MEESPVMSPTSVGRGGGGVTQSNYNADDDRSGLVHAVFVPQTQDEDNRNENRYSTCSTDVFDQIMDDDTTEFEKFERQIEEMSKMTQSDYTEEKEFGDLPPLRYSNSELFNSDGASYRSSDSLTSNSSSKRSLEQPSTRRAFQTELEVKLEERKRSLDSQSQQGDNNEDNCLQLMERRQFRSFSRADEYLYAMKEDLAEWLNMLYPGIDIDAENFMDKLETGEHLVKVREISFRL